jgi:nitroreductase
MDTISAIHSRRSIRDYQPRPVDRTLLSEILWDAAQAPTPPVSGPDPFAFIVIEGAARVADCGGRALAFARDHHPPGAAYDWADDPAFSVFFNAPAAVIICGYDDGLGQAIQDCNRAGQNLMLSAHARGLGTCWVGSPMLWLRAPAARAELAIPDRCHAHAAFALGYPAATPAGRPRPTPAVIWR